MPHHPPALAAPARRPRHLIDPENPRPRRKDRMSLGRVQIWVLSTLAQTTILHMSVGLILAALHVEGADTVAQVGLLVNAGMFGVFSVVAGLAIHRRRILSWWLLLGWTPTLVGAWLVFWR